MMHTTLDNWIRHEAIPFSIDSSETFNASIDMIIESLDDSVELLGFGEALHGGEDILMLRNRLFQRLVKMHGYSAIAIENSFPRARVVNDYVAGHGPTSYEAVQARALVTASAGSRPIAKLWSGCGATMPILPIASNSVSTASIFLS